LVLLRTIIIITIVAFCMQSTFAPGEGNRQVDDGHAHGASEAAGLSALAFGNPLDIPGLYSRYGFGEVYEGTTWMEKRGGDYSA
jgi:hypothetical protein